MILACESMPMRLSKRLGLTRVAWALRRLHCPVAAEALVLEVGSGGNPYARANVLLDAYEVTGQRHWVPLVSDRPTILGFVESLPFKDKAFDFVIASHVLEHSSEPERFLAELQRVAKAGYIEVPDAFMERIPMKRWGTPADMAAAALFLASEDAGYISGSNLFVDGAWATTGYPDLQPFTNQLVG